MTESNEYVLISSVSVVLVYINVIMNDASLVVKAPDYMAEIFGLADGR